jgi:hypothetical protein
MSFSVEREGVESLSPSREDVSSSSTTSPVYESTRAIDIAIVLNG